MEIPGEGNEVAEERLKKKKRGTKNDYIYFSIFLGWLYTQQYEKKLIFLLIFAPSDFLYPGLTSLVELHSLNELLGFC